MRQALGVALHRDLRVGLHQPQPVSVLFQGGAASLDGVLQDRVQREGCEAKLELAAVDAVDVEQVVDQPDQLAQLAVHDFAGACRHGGIALGALEHFEHVAQGGKRIAQLMRQHRQEFVLVPPFTRQFRFRDMTFEQFGGLPRKQIDVAQGLRGGAAGPRVMVVEHAEQLAAAAEQRRALNRPDVVRQDDL